jgi:uncharacterized protein
VSVFATNPTEHTESADTATPRASWPARALMLPIRAYRLVSVHLAPRCRFHPSCSAYALEALEVHGAAKGTWMAVRRVGRCHPWHEGGLDPVPPATRSTRRRSTRNPRPNTCSHDAAHGAAEETHR